MSSRALPNASRSLTQREDRLVLRPILRDGLDPARSDTRLPAQRQIDLLNSQLDFSPELFIIRKDNQFRR